MAQHWLGLKLETASKDEEVEAKKGGFPTYKFKRSRTYLIIATDMTENEDDILANENVPILGDTAALGQPVKTRKATEVTKVIHPITHVPTILWEVEVASDSTLDFGVAGGESQKPPLERRPVLKWTTAEEEVDFEYDVRTGDYVSNSNNERIFDTRKVYYPVLNITRYESYYTDIPAIQRTYANTLNQAIFCGFPVETCLMLPVEVEEETLEYHDFAGDTEEEPGEDITVTLQKVTYRIECKVNDYYGDRPWRARYLNQGYYVRPNAGAVPQLNAPEGNKTLVNLKLDGTAVPVGDEPTYVSGDKYKMVDWTPLGLNDVYVPPEEP